MNVLDNVAYGLMVKGVGKAERQREARGRADAGQAAGLRRAPAGPALRRPAPARRARPRAGQPAQGAAARRAARRARPEAAREHAGGAEGAAEVARHHLRLRHPRPGRGAVDGRPRRRLQRRPHHAGRHAARTSTSGRRLALRRRFRRLLQRAAAGFRRSAMAASARWASLRPEAIRIGDGPAATGVAGARRVASAISARRRALGLDVEGTAHQRRRAGRRGRCRPKASASCSASGRRRAASDGRRGMSAAVALRADARRHPAATAAACSGALSDLFWRRPKLLLFLMLRRRCCGSASSISARCSRCSLQSFFSIDEFSGLINREFTLKTYGELLQPSNLDIIMRTVVDGGAGDARLGRRRLPDRLLRGALCARANGRRCSISASCCRCGRAIWSRSMPGS